MTDIDLAMLTEAEMDDLDAFGVSPRPSLPQLLREGADDLHPFAVGDTDQPSMNCALPAYLNEAAAMIEAQADEITSLRASTREDAAEIERLREMVRQFVDMHDDAVSNPAGGPSLGGLMDARDNDGAVYQSQALANLIFRARAMDGEG